VLAALVCLYALNQTVNMMTLAGLALAIGPLVDTAIVCLENTHRHLGMGADPRDAALEGASEVAVPELAATCSTLLVLVPLALMPGGGQFLFLPLVLAVALAMSVAYLLSRTFIPSRAANWLRPHRAETHAEPAGLLRRVSTRLQAGIAAGFGWYQRQLDRVLRQRLLTVGTAVAALTLVLVFITPHVRREFFPETDAGAFEIYVRANTGTRLTETEKHVADVEQLIRDIVGDDLDLVVSELGVWADWSAAYTPNAGPMDAVVKVQLTNDRGHSAQTYAAELRDRIAKDPRFAALEFAFNTGGTIRSALNEGTSTPINIRIESKDLSRSHAVAERVRRAVVQIDGVVDARVMQRMDYPTYVVDVDRAMARRLGLTQQEVMENVVAALKSSIQYNKKNFWFDPVTHNQYYIGVQYSEQDIQSLATLLNVSVTSPVQAQPIPLSNLVRLRPTTMAAEVTHANLQSTIDVTMNVVGRDLGHIADDIAAALDRMGKSQGDATWLPYDPDAPDQQPLAGSTLHLSGEYAHMRETFWNFGIGLSLAVVFIYFLMVVLLDSYLIPLVILLAVPVGLVGVVPMLFVTGTAINVQSLLGVIFMVGIVVSNTVLLVDFAQKLRVREKLSPTDAIRKAAGIRAKPVVMTALAALFSLIPMALALERGSEANAPLGRAVIGGLIAGLVATLVVVPALYSLLVRDNAKGRPQS
jgi:multidrug efflux pump subunit AcrB